MTQAHLPFGGKSATARACSMKAANDAARTRGVKSALVLRMLAESGARGLTRHDLEAITGYRTSSLCSIVDTLVSAAFVAEHGSRPSGPWMKDCTIYVRTRHQEGRVA